jgi:hypothetical protein
LISAQIWRISYQTQTLLSFLLGHRRRYHFGLCLSHAAAAALQSVYNMIAATAAAASCDRLPLKKVGKSWFKYDLVDSLLTTCHTI